MRQNSMAMSVPHPPRSGEPHDLVFGLWNHMFCTSDRERSGTPPDAYRAPEYPDPSPALPPETVLIEDPRGFYKTGFGPP